MALSDAQRTELELLIRCPKYGSSYRDRYRARTRLKRLGMIKFDRKAVVLPAGRRALQEGGRDGSLR